MVHVECTSNLAEDPVVVERRQSRKKDGALFIKTWREKQKAYRLQEKRRGKDKMRCESEVSEVSEVK